MSGTIKCSGYQVSTKWLTTVEFIRRHASWNHFGYLMCSFKEVETNNESLKGYDKFCWNNSLTFSGRPYTYHSVCAESPKCISQYRIADEEVDCSHQRDEEWVWNEKLCQQIQKHRFKCSEKQSTCMYAQQMGAVLLTVRINSMNICTRKESL